MNIDRAYQEIPEYRKKRKKDYWKLEGKMNINSCKNCVFLRTGKDLTELDKKQIEAFDGSVGGVCFNSPQFALILKEQLKNNTCGCGQFVDKFTHKTYLEIIGVKQ